MKQKLTRMRLQDPKEDYDPLDIIKEPSNDIDSGEITQVIKAAADKLPEKQRIVFILKYLQQMKKNKTLRLLVLPEVVVSTAKTLFIDPRSEVTKLA